jgi:hypothetical protein
MPGGDMARTFTRILLLDHLSAYDDDMPIAAGLRG